MNKRNKKNKANKGKVIFDIFNYIFLGVFAFAALYPFIYTVSISLSTAAEAAREGLHLYPKEISLLAYQMVLKNESILSGYMNTIFRTVVGTLISLVMVSMAAYPLSRKYMPNRSLYILMILLTMLFNGGMIPNYLLIKSLHLIDNQLVYILPCMLNAFYIIVVKNFFQSIPDSLSESAKIDGANEFGILFRIILPLSTPVLATVALWLAIWHWNSWFDALLYINTNNKLVLQLFLQRIVIQNSIQMIEKGIISPDMMEFTPETVKSATIIVTILPILCIYPFLQKYFVKGIMLGSVKG